MKYTKGNNAFSKIYITVANWLDAESFLFFFLPGTLEDICQPPFLLGFRACSYSLTAQVHVDMI